MLAKSLSPEQIQTLQAALQDEDQAVRYNAGLDLVKQGHLEGIPPLIEAFRHESWVVRHFYAGQILVDLGPSALPALTAAFDTADEQTQLVAACTL